MYVCMYVCMYMCVYICIYMTNYTSTAIIVAGAKITVAVAKSAMPTDADGC